MFGAFGRDFTTADGQRVMVVGLTGKQWRCLCEAMHLGEAMDSLGARLGLDLSREGDRFRARASIAEHVGAWVSARSFADAAQAFDHHGVCWSRYQSIGELVRDPECSPANPMFRTVEQPGVGPMLAAGIPLEFSAMPRTAAEPAPRLGEHTEQVLLEILGMDGAQFGKLHDRGIVRAAG